jgi:hypothetical protein
MRNTIVTLNRSKEDLEYQKRVGDTYNRMTTLRENEFKQHAQRIVSISCCVWLGFCSVWSVILSFIRPVVQLDAKKDAFVQLPHEMRAAAVQRDTVPFPPDMMPPTETPPIPDFDPLKSYSKS